MASYFVTSFAATEQRGYASRFHDDLDAEVSRQLGGRKIRTGRCVESPSAEARRALVAEAGVLVVLYSPDFFADSACGRDWAVFQRRLGHVPAQDCSGAVRARVLVRWRPLDSRPPGLPWAPRLDGDALTDYNEGGLHEVIRRQGRPSAAYRAALRTIAEQVREGNRAALPPDDGPLPEPFFPLLRTVPKQPDHGVEPEPPVPPRVFISYAHAEDQPGHIDDVHTLADLLKARGMNVRIDRDAAEEPQIWNDWMRAELKQADYILTVASPAYRRRAEKREDPGRGLGATWEGAYLMDQVYLNPTTWVKRIIRVVLPPYDTVDLPEFPGSASAHHYRIDPATGGGDLNVLVRYLKRGPAQ
ncbi:TIR domain-containing protein [Streptomyces sp. NPDC059690]|uniref:TIR domain-containing protein n=1 Tax=Streptomyces sp. NPDC059690 TaxID=3346907 RepID=UPI00368AAF25